MRSFVIALVFLTAAIIQTSFVEHIRLFGVVPNLFIVLVICFSLLEGGLEGALIGALAGIIQDAVIGNSLGGYTLINMYLGLIVGNVNKQFVKDNVLVAISFAFLFSALYEVVFYFVVLFFRGQVDVVYTVDHIILPESIYNAVITLAVFPIVSIINKTIREHSRILRKY